LEGLAGVQLLPVAASISVILLSNARVKLCGINQARSAILGAYFQPMRLIKLEGVLLNLDHLVYAQVVPQVEGAALKVFFYGGTEVSFITTSEKDATGLLDQLLRLQGGQRGHHVT
jgi:hypothetical protein